MNLKYLPLLKEATFEPTELSDEENDLMVDTMIAEAKAIRALRRMSKWYWRLYYWVCKKFE